MLAKPLASLLFLFFCGPLIFPEPLNSPLSVTIVFFPFRFKMDNQKEEEGNKEARISVSLRRSRSRGSNNKQETSGSRGTLLANKNEFEGGGVRSNKVAAETRHQRSSSKCEGEGRRGRSCSREEEEERKGWSRGEEGRRRINSLNIKQLASHDSGYIEAQNISAYFTENR